MVEVWLIFRREQILDHSEEVNWVPLSLVIIEGTPKREIQPGEFFPIFWKSGEFQTHWGMGNSPGIT